MTNHRNITKIGTGINPDKAYFDAFDKVDNHQIEGNYSDYEITNYLILRIDGIDYCYMGATLIKDDTLTPAQASVPTPNSR